ncbi:uncharacterized protein TRIADDRAFT_51290 [Trichoplax adhaerens]|uniref:Uncharacterized protein n=1 Tax=Trichoplax adhaerens TaxID=10228 RepID=B3RIE4_TRIAD|nr:hypothetical protein TRIADDRAFT_51290 [Trichoplax adhaerens]EDV29222.1 hypothetical protein TRIADDRAFT_51290 [Trichoplax adhaerens]|eukprot:XP_002108424.1 hypothetical protein TRIADDRAFT_51290 [Trichoplax adhaerens]
MAAKKPIAMLLEAIDNHNIEQMESAIRDYGVSIRQPIGAEKLTIIQRVVIRGALECLHWLLWHGADANDKTPQGWTAAHLAAIKGRSTCLEALCNNGASINNKDLKGNTPAHLASIHGNAHTLQTILRYGGDTHARDNESWKPAHCAAFFGRLGCLQVLRKWGANFNEIDDQGNTAAHLAAKEGHLECLKFIICKSASIDFIVNSRNNQGDAPKDIALRFYKDRCVEYLNAVGIAFPAHAAAFYGNLEKLQTLIEEGVVSVDEQDNHGSTLAHKAAGNGHINILRWLMEQGCDVTIRNEAGETPKDVAKRYAQMGAVELLGGEVADEIIEDENLDDAMELNDDEKIEAQGRASHRIEELKRLLKIAKANYHQLGGLLDEDIETMDKQAEYERTITELEAQLNYERSKREKLEAKIDQLNTKIHLLNKQIDDVTNKYSELLKGERNTPKNNSTNTTVAKSSLKKNYRRSSRDGGILLERTPSKSKAIDIF